ncbi:ATP-binding cassette sub-family C member Sur-like, partial [Homarus americanus]
MTFFMHCHYIWAIPLKVSVIMVLLWVQLGISAVIAAVVGILVLTPLQCLLCKKIGAVNKNFLDVSDDRLRQTHELVTGVKLVKVHAWEDVFIKRITAVRHKELKLLQHDSILRALMKSAALEPARVFSGLALFNQLTVPLFILPIIVSHTITAMNSTRRLQKFFSSPEVEGPKTPKTPITLRIPRGGGGGGGQTSLGAKLNLKENKLLDDNKTVRLSQVTEES